jgi:hypothetical protein
MRPTFRGRQKIVHASGVESSPRFTSLRLPWINRRIWRCSHARDSCFDVPDYRPGRSGKQGFTTYYS